jgi:hypothetical protein
MIFLLHVYKMNHPQPVVIKKNVAVPSLLKNFMDYGFECIHDFNFAERCLGMSALDTNFTFEIRKVTSNSESRGVNVKLGRHAANNFYPSLVNNTNRKTHVIGGGAIPVSIRALFREASRHIKSVQCDGLVIDYALQVHRQTMEYFSIKIAIVAYQMLLMNQHGVDTELRNFMTTYNSGYVHAVARHAQKPSYFNDGFKIAWHRDTASMNHHKGMVTTGLYIHRASEMDPRSGGISFAKDGKEVRLFPEAGTVVSFLDQHVVHKVIPIKVLPSRPLPPDNHGFVQRSAVFMSWHTTNQIINTHSNTGFFRKAGIKHNFRNLKKLYLLLHKYFTHVKNTHAPGSSLHNFIASGPANRIAAAYSVHGGTNYNALLAEGGYPANTQAPVANLVLYKVRNSPNNSTPRTKLKNLNKVYSDLKSVFGNVGAGQGRTNKHSLLLRRGGRVEHTPNSSGFIRNLA